MVWMLLTPSRAERPHPTLRRRGGGAGAIEKPLAGAPAERGASTDGAAAERARDAAPEGALAEAWILLGDLDAALFQAGVVSVWLETRDRPRVIFAGGMSALNALLACDGDPLAFRIGWERLRAAHVLAAAALERTPLASFLRRNGSVDLTPTLAPPREGTAVRVLASGGFVDVNGGPAYMAALLDDVLHHRATAHALAVAIDGAVASGARHVLVPGADERMVEQREVVRAIEDARGDGVDVSLLPMDVRGRPGFVGYLLPGLGRADRLLRAGSEVARRWGRDASDEALRPPAAR